MVKQTALFFPVEGIQILLVLFLSFLIGLEREEHKAGTFYSFGGVRTFPLIGLIGYVIALLSGNQMIPVALGFAVVGALLVVSYIHKLSTEKTSGVTSEISALGTYLLGALVYHNQLWIATTIAVISMFLLELKTTLEGLTKRVPPPEIFTFTKFLLLTAVILPVLPRESLTRQFDINPFKIWLVVVAVSTISYGSYVLLKLTSGAKGVLLSALLGGAYSSTVTTIALARRSASEQQPHLFSGATLVASGMMYLRLALLLALFNRGLLRLLALPFVVLAGAAVLVGWLWSRIPDPKIEEGTRKFEPRNPLELRAALMFAALFVGMIVVTRLAVVYLGQNGVYALAAIMGLSDVDPFILGVTQSAGRDTTLIVGAVAITIAATSNNMIKGFYAYAFSDRKTSRQSLCLLLALALAGLAPLLWLLR